ncbi:MAG: hypothetical protein OXD54_11155 [Candidatus Poribacteria bacterium]|nr:hypothetical protein [Candidatus Poribacteria bacterium]
MENRKLVIEFVAHLEIHRHPNLQIECFPDEKNSTTPDIDAIAGPFAIEHTSIDTIPNQRLNSDRFLKVIGNLEQEFASLPFYLGITFTESAITIGQDWLVIRAALKNWILEDTPNLSVDKPYTPHRVPEIPFTIYVTKNTDLSGRLSFSRFGPDDNTLFNRVKDLFGRKAAKLKKYQRDGKTTLLLVENNDIALMCDYKLLKATKQAFPDGPPDGIDEIWYVDTSIGDESRFVNFTHKLVQNNKLTTSRRSNNLLNYLNTINTD